MNNTTYYQNLLLIVGPLKECLKGLSELDIDFSSQILVASEANAKIKQHPLPRNLPLLVDLSAHAVAEKWDRVFPEGEKGDQAIGSIPDTLWANIMAHLPLRAPESFLDYRKTFLKKYNYSQEEGEGEGIEKEGGDLLSCARRVCKVLGHTPSTLFDKVECVVLHGWCEYSPTYTPPFHTTLAGSV